MNQQQQSHSLRTLSRSYWGLKLILLGKSSPLDYVVVKTKKIMLSSRGGFLIYQMYLRGETIKLLL